MVERRGDPLGLLDAIRRDIDRVVGMVRRREDNPDPTDAASPAEVATPPVPPEFDMGMAALLERKREPRERTRADGLTQPH